MPSQGGLTRLCRKYLYSNYYIFIFKEQGSGKALCFRAPHSHPAGLEGGAVPHGRWVREPGPSARNSPAGMDCQTWPRAGGDEPVIIFKFAIIDFGKSCGDRD